MTRTLLLAVLACVSTALAGGGGRSGGLVLSHAPFASSAFCSAQGCRLLGSVRLRSEPGGYWTATSRYRLGTGERAVVLRYDDPRHPSERGRILAMSVTLPGPGRAPLAAAFGTLGLGRRVTAGEVEGCLRRARATPAARGARVGWIPSDRHVGVRCVLNPGGGREVTVTVTD